MYTFHIISLNQMSPVAFGRALITALHWKLKLFQFCVSLECLLKIFQWSRFRFVNVTTWQNDNTSDYICGWVCNKGITRNRRCVSLFIIYDVIINLVELLQMWHRVFKHFYNFCLIRMLFKISHIQLALRLELKCMTE